MGSLSLRDNETSYGELRGPAALLIYPGGHHRRPVLERIVGFLREHGLQVIICHITEQAIEFGRSWAGDLADHWIWASDSEMVLESIRGWDIKACFTYDEFGVELASTVAEALGVYGTPPDVVRQVQNKYSFRQASNSCGGLVNSSWQIRCTADFDAVDDVYPKVLKPTRGGGSYCCKKVHSEDELRAAYALLSPELAAVSTMPGRAKADGFVVETYIGGNEFDLDAVVANGKIVFSLLSDNNPALEPDFLETGGTYPSLLPASAQERILDVASRLVSRWPQLSTVVHFEGKIVDQGVFPLEMNMRLGGAEAPAAVWAASGLDLAIMVPKLALFGPAAVEAELRALSLPPLTCVRSINVQLDPAVAVVQRCGPREGTEGPESLSSFVGAQFYSKPGSKYVGTGSQRTVAWVAASGSSPEAAELALQECLNLCEFAGDTEDSKED